MYKIAINGFGCNILRAYFERPEIHDQIKIIAINHLGNVDINAHLLQFDTVHDRFNQTVTVGGNDLRVNDRQIQ